MFLGKLGMNLPIMVSLSNHDHPLTTLSELQVEAQKRVLLRVQCGE
jgi:hypothetical protein